MYLRESQQEQSSPSVERRVRGQVARTGMPPVPPLADAGYANSLGVEYFCLVADREQRVADPSGAAAVVAKD